MIHEMPAIKILCKPAKSFSIEDLDPIFMTEDALSFIFVYSYKRQYGMARRIEELFFTLSVDLSTGFVEQGPIFNGPFPVIINGVDNRFLLVHDENIRKGGLLRTLLLGFSDTQERINRWLLHCLRVSSTEVSYFHPMAGPPRSQLGHQTPVRSRIGASCS